MRVEPITWERLTEAVTDRALAAGLTTGGAEGAGSRLRVGVDGAPAAGAGEFATRIEQALRLRGRPGLTVGTGGFLRPASLRYEYGREDPDAYYDDWFDTGALWREVFGPLEEGGTGRVLPDLWDPVTDRATRSPAVRVPGDGVLLLYGPFLLGHGFPFDLTVHLRLSPAALRRRTPRAEQWTLPAFGRYEEEAGPERTADIVVRVDDPRHPAWGVPD
ncbi:uridine kinase [Streptomyces sp. NPDC006798]|uniref:uridine kinase n=1 Tax=Streptomyces sp. NPDC006798 TaxID=3155462 RepID=UPI0033FD0BDD